MTKETEKLTFMAGMFIALLCFCMGLLVLPQTISTEMCEYTNDSIMTAEGVFDRVELVDRHHGVWNGQEIEGELLAVLYGNGSVAVSAEHYDAYWNYPDRNYLYLDDINYLFYLYVYDGVDHLRESISAEGGTSEDYIYSNVTVTVCLSKGTITHILTTQVGILYSAGLWVVSVFFVLKSLDTWMERNDE